MSQTVYTNYWFSRRDNVRKEHGSFASEEEAIQAIKAWWDLQGDEYSNVTERRTNSGEWEVTYGDGNYYYRVVKREVDFDLPSQKVKLRKPGEIESLRKKLDLDKDLYLFDELAEPYRDRLVQAMGDGKKVQTYLYDEYGRLVKPID